MLISIHALCLSVCLSVCLSFSLSLSLSLSSPPHNVTDNSLSDSTDPRISIARFVLSDLDLQFLQKVGKSGLSALQLMDVQQ